MEPMTAGRARDAGHELDMVEAELGQFADLVRSMASPRPMTRGDGRRLVTAMISVVGVCHAAAASPAARRVAGQRGALDAYERLVGVCSSNAPVPGAGHAGVPADGDALEVETAVMRCYDATRPVLMAAAQLVR